MSLEDRLSFALKISRKMADYQLKAAKGGFKTQRKSDNTPVTEVDQKSEQMFREAVKATYPDDEILGEEDGGGLVATRWVIDPIDGTRKFVRNMPFWGICIAYEVEGECVLGVVTIPGLDLQWSAYKNGGAYLGKERIQVDKANAELSSSFLTMPSRPHFVKEKAEGLYDMLQQDIEHDPGFLDACSYGMVADGRLHGVVSCGDQWWDIAAPIAIVREAGGRFTDLQGGEPQAGKINVAAAPGIHEQILSRSQKS